MKMHSLFITPFLLLFGLQVCRCQVENDTINKSWLTAGAGIYASNNSAGAGGNIAFNNLSKSFLWKIRFALASDNFEKFSDIGILFGGASSGKNSRLSFSAGLGFAYGSREEKPDYSSWDQKGPVPKPEYKNISSVAFPVEAQLSFLLSKEFGIGISLFADLNFQCSFYGLNCNLEFGKLK